jgi:hypothetical protein
MRSAVLELLEQVDLGSFRLSQELPWPAAGEPLYEKNPKVFYVDETQIAETSLIAVLLGGGPAVRNRETTFSIWVTCDAKQQPTDYDQVIDRVRAAVISLPGPEMRRRESDTDRTFTADRLVTELEFRFTETVRN